MPNKQPLFTSTPILYTDIYDPDIFDFTSPSIGSYYYQASETTLIDRVTVQIPADSTYPDWTSKTIYIILYNNSTYSIYQREEITGGTYSAGTNLPSIEWNFQGGLLLRNNDQISIQASTNRTATGYRGDYLSVTIEGGTYATV